MAKELCSLLLLFERRKAVASCFWLRNYFGSQGFGGIGPGAYYRNEGGVGCMGSW